MISKKASKEFKEIYQKEFDIELSDKDALEKTIKLLNLMKAVYKPMLKDDYKKLKKHREETEGYKNKRQ